LSRGFLKKIFDRKKNPVQRHLNLYKDRTKSHRRVDLENPRAQIMLFLVVLPFQAITDFEKLFQMIFFE